MQVIDLKTALPKIRAALDSKTLGAFQTYGNCMYEYPPIEGVTPTHHCAIGKCLSPETLIRVKNEGLNAEPVGDLIRQGIISIPNDEDRTALYALQLMHDRWGLGRPLDKEVEIPTIEATGFEIGEWRYASEDLFREFLTFLERKFQ